MLALYLLGLALLAAVAYLLGRIDGVAVGRALGFRAGAAAQREHYWRELAELAEKRGAAGIAKTFRELDALDRNE